MLVNLCKGALCIASGILKCTIKLCSDEIKLKADSKPQHCGLLDLLKQNKNEYFTYDIHSDKPLKVVLRALGDLPVKKLQKLLVDSGLLLTGVYKIARQDNTRKYRDQLYLVH